MAIFAAGSSAQAADVNITTSTNTGVNLDTQVGSTVEVFPGVTVTNTAAASMSAVTTVWTLTNRGTVGPNVTTGNAVDFTLNNSAVFNFGTITTTGANTSAFLRGGGTVQNEAGATISATTGQAVTIGTGGVGVGTVTNFGTISNTNGGDTVALRGGGTITNNFGATISGQNGSNAASISGGTSRTVFNAGTITNTRATGFTAGVLIQGAGATNTITNTATGTIFGSFNGVYGSSTAAITLNNQGSITSERGPAVELDGGGTVTNSATIQTSATSGTAPGIEFSNNGSITNTGTIGGSVGGVARAITFLTTTATQTLTLGTGSVLNGTVQGTNGTGSQNLVLTGSNTEDISKFLLFETLAMQGSNWALTGTGAFTTSTAVTAGVMRINGQLTTPTVTVANGGTLGGTGIIVSAVTINGNIAPGNSIGTLNITGPYVQAAGSTYTVELNTTTSDLINVTGTATIQAGASVVVVGAPGFYTLGQRYTILTASAGVTGQYSSLSDNLPFVDFTLASDINNIFLDVSRSSISFQEIAQTPNQRAAATGAEALGAGNAVFDAVVMLDAPNAKRAFDLLSGEIHASITGTMLEDSRYVRDAINGRLRQSVGGPASIFAPQFATLSFGEVESDVDALMFDDPAMAYATTKRKRVRDTMDRALPVKAAPAATGRVFTAWGQAFGNFGRTDGDGNAASLRRTSGGFITGMDVTVPGSLGDIWRAGFAGGYQHTSVNVGDRNSSGGIDSYHLAAYGGRQIGPLGLRAGASYGWHDVSTSRSIVFPGFNDATKAKYGANTAQVFGEVGYGLTYRQFALEPFAGIAYVNVHTDSFVETGGAAALAGSGGTTDTTYSTVGLRAAAPLPWQNLSNLIAKSSVGWRHAFGTVTPTAQLGFASGATPFVVAGVPIARDAAAVEVGLEGRVWRNATLGLAYTGQLASHSDDHGVNANFVQRF